MYISKRFLANSFVKQEARITEIAVINVTVTNRLPTYFERFG